MSIFSTLNASVLAKIHGEEGVRQGNHKKTRRWCKGRVGVPHRMVWHNYMEMRHAGIYPDFPWWQEMCSVCGRHGKLRNSVKVVGAE